MSKRAHLHPAQPDHVADLGKAVGIYVRRLHLSERGHQLPEHAPPLGRRLEMALFEQSVQVLKPPRVEPLPDARRLGVDDALAVAAEHERNHSRPLFEEIYRSGRSGRNAALYQDHNLHAVESVHAHPAFLRILGNFSLLPRLGLRRQ